MEPYYHKLDILRPYVFDRKFTRALPRIKECSNALGDRISLSLSLLFHSRMTYVRYLKIYRGNIFRFVRHFCFYDFLPVDKENETISL